MIQLAAIVVKETKLLFRDIGALLMLFFLPAVFIVVLSVALQGAFAAGETRERLEVLVVNQDRGELGVKLIKTLGETGRFTVVTKLDGHELTLAQAQRALGQGRYKVGVAIPPDTTKSLELESESTIEILVDPALSKEFVALVKGSVDGFVFF